MWKNFTQTPSSRSIYKYAVPEILEKENKVQQKTVLYVQWSNQSSKIIYTQKYQIYC
jgi:hypothetical protein